MKTYLVVFILKDGREITEEFRVSGHWEDKTWISPIEELYKLMGGYRRKNNLNLEEWKWQLLE